MKAALLPLSATLALATLAPETNAFELKRVTELRREWISPEAQLVLHFDFESFQKTSIWKLLQENSDDWEMDELDEFRTEFGIDPFNDLKSFTAYSKSDEPDDGVALLHGSGNLEQALKRIQEEKEYSQIAVDGFDLHVWTEHGRQEAVAYIHEMAGGDKVVVLSDTEANTIEAARIVRGDLPNHKSGNGGLPITPQTGSFFYLSTASIPGIDDLPPASRIAGLTKNIHIDIGETQGNLGISVSAVADSPEDAVQASKMIEGFKALGYFAAQELGITNMLEAIQVNTRGSQILIDFSYNVQALVDEIQELKEEHNF